MKLLMIICVLHFFVVDFSHALGENCTETANCTVSEKSVCLKGICTCDTLFYYYEAQEKCIKYVTDYGSVCYEDEQCVFFGQNAACQGNMCLCSPGYRWYQGACRKYSNKGESCNENSICLDPSNPLALNCSASKRCECSDGFYDRGEDCRFKSELGNECAIRIDCFPTVNQYEVPDVYSHCELGTCIKDPKQNYLGLETRSDSEEPGADVIYNDNESCPHGVLSNLTKPECFNCSNTLYFRNACICKQGFFLQGSNCIAELGVLDETVNYKNDSDCPIKPGKLTNGTCYCRNYWFQGSTNKECKKTTLQVTRNCMDNDWCKAMGEYAYCNTDSGKCQCMSQAVLNETSFYCKLNNGANLTGVCLSDTDCALYETCTNERCQCTEGFYKLDDSGLCLPKIGYSCEFRNCSHIDSAVCSNEVCECSSGYVSNGLLCLPPSTKIGDECLIEEQCTNLKHTSCMKDSSEYPTTRCLCNSEYKDVEGVCYHIKYPGSMCSTQADCTIILGDTFVCRNMLCQCPIGKSLNESSICVSSSAQRWVVHTTLAALLVLILSSQFLFE